MKRFSQLLPKISILLFFCLLLLFPQLSVEGAKSGLFLWLYQVVPSLLPFLILSSLFLATGLSEILAKLLAPFLSPLLRCSKESCVAFVIGTLAGLPVGAKTVADYVAAKKISKEEGENILPLCNHAGPLFCLGFLSCSVINQPQFSYLFYGVVLFVPILISTLFRKKTKTAETSAFLSSKSVSFSFAMLNTAIEQAFLVLFRILGFLVLFSVLASLLSVLPLPPFLLASALSFLEITTGSAALSALCLPIRTLLPVLTGFTVFGGLSALAQTKSVLAGSKLRLTHYVFVKITSAVISAFLMRFILCFL